MCVWVCAWVWCVCKSTYVSTLRMYSSSFAFLLFFGKVFHFILLCLASSLVLEFPCDLLSFCFAFLQQCWIIDTWPHHLALNSDSGDCIQSLELCGQLLYPLFLTLFLFKKIFSAFLLLIVFFILTGTFLSYLIVTQHQLISLSPSLYLYPLSFSLLEPI